MAYPWINLLATLLFASSLNLPTEPAQIDDNLIQSTIISLNRQVNRASGQNVPLPSSSRSPAVDSQALTTIPGERYSPAAMENPAARSGSRVRSDDQRVELIDRPRARKPSGCLLVRVEAAPVESTRSTAIQATLVSARKAGRGTSRPTSGSYLFRIERVSTGDSAPPFQIDPRILPNYQYIPDPYWQYYSDCDQWGILFTIPCELPSRPWTGLPAQGLASFLVHPGPAMREWLATRVDWAADWKTLTATYQNSIQPLWDRLIHQHLDRLAGKQNQRTHRLTMEHQAPFSTAGSQRQPDLATCWFSIAAQCLLKEALETELISSPGTWLDRQIETFDTRYGETLHGTMIRQWAQSVNREIQVAKKRESQSKIQRGFANRLNWLSIQLKRVASAIEENAEQPHEVVRENDETVHY